MPSEEKGVETVPSGEEEEKCHDEEDENNYRQPSQQVTKPLRRHIWQ
jgi:hypothetical protein